MMRPSETAIRASRRITAVAVVLTLGFAFVMCLPAAAAPRGLVAGPEGTVLKEGAPYAGVGVNYFNCFLRTLQREGDTSYDEGFRVLAEHGIPFARFCATGFWPTDMRLYQTNRAEYFRRFDGVVRSAERHGVGLIPSLFWHYPCVPDLVGERMDQWGNPASRTHAFMREYVREVVGRYKESPAIWAWEFGNEFNLACNLPNAAEHRPAVVPTLGTATDRTERDEPTYAMLNTALREFARAVRQIDPDRLITDGNSILRPHAWHNLHERNWKADSEAQFQEMLALVSPDPVNLVSIHCYEEALNRLEISARAAARLKKPLFVGEFQVERPDSPEAPAALKRFLEQLRQHRVPLAALWVFDYPPQEKDFNVSLANSRAWQLGVLRDGNARLKQPETGASTKAEDAPKQFLVFNTSQGASPALFAEIRREFPLNSASRIQPGIAAIFSYLGHPRDQVEKRLREFLRLSAEHQMPVVVQLDGENWWQARPDLWNWWDPARPGYAASNRWNVEWTGWSPDDAIKIAWRNWGRQLRVLPPPNLMSPRYREACHEEMRRLIPIVLEWWRDLPPANKHQLIGIKLGWESSIGVNAWYYPNGNALLDQPSEQDPVTGLKASQVPDRGVQQIGYAAVSTAGLRREGAVTEADLAEVVRRHLDDLCSVAARLGVPREKLFTHVAGWKEEERLYGTAVNEFSCPGWSFYSHAADPRQDQGVQKALAESDAPHWAAVEWLFQGPAAEKPWRDAVSKTLDAPRLRYLCIYNWEGIRDKPPVLAALRQVFQKTP